MNFLFYSFLQPLVTWFLSGPNTLFSMLFKAHAHFCYIYLILTTQYMKITKLTILKTLRLMSL